jgi:ascorbate-specific PTS system EIIC-type component UlaA
VFSSAATDILTNARGGKRATLRVAAADAQLRSAETTRAKNRLRAARERQGAAHEGGRADEGRLLNG